MTRKITTILLALALCLTLLPVGAGAATSGGYELKNDTGNNLLCGDAAVTAENNVYIYNYTDQIGTITYQATLQATGYVLNGGTYYLGEDVTIDKPLLIKGTSTNPTTLDLNGHVLQKTGDTGSVIAVVQDAHFVLKDTSTDNDIHRFTEDSTTGLYTLTDDGAIPLTGGVITGGTGIANGSFTYGGGVYVGSAATFEMTGGNIVGCTATQNGGGVALYRGNTGNKTKFTMTGGSIVGCTALFGGGVHTDADTRNVADSIFTLNGGTIQNCTAGQTGGGVFAAGEFTMGGNSSIEGCTAIGEGGFGGGVATGGFIAEFTMEDGTIKNCTAGNSGGGVYHQYGTFTMKGGTITDCTAERKDGGVYISGSRYNFNDLIPTMDAQGGSVYGGVYIDGVVGSTTGSSAYGKLTNDSPTGSTIVYPDKNGNAIVKDGDNATIDGKRVTFMNGGALYAETVAADGNAKISQPVAPTAVEGKHFAGWYTSETSGTKWEFTTNTVSSDNTTLYAQWHTLNHVPAKTPAAGVKGNIEYWYCDVCNAYFSDENGTAPTSLEAVTLDALPHRTYRTTATIESPKTADAGVAIYAVMALTSYTGTALVVRGRKRK